MTGSHFRGGWLVFCRREKKQVTIYRSRAITRRLVGVIAVAKIHAVYFFALL